MEGRKEGKDDVVMCFIGSLSIIKCMLGDARCDDERGGGRRLRFAEKKVKRDYSIHTMNLHTITRLYINICIMYCVLL